MHIPGHRVSPQVSLLTVRPGTVYWCPRRTVTRRLTQAVIKAHSVADPLTLFSPSKVRVMYNYSFNALDYTSDRTGPEDCCYSDQSFSKDYTETS